MKTEVYSWRVSTEIKTGLEREARRRQMSLSAVLDLAAKEWLMKSGSEDDDQEQTRLQEAAAEFIGSIAGSDPQRSESVSRLVRRSLHRKHGR